MEQQFGSLPAVHTCMIYCGDKDPIYPEVKKAAKLIVDCTFISLNGLNHMQSMIEGHEVLPHFLIFLEEHKC